ncbi:MAG: CehA/McbA family metallohydrolase [Armatimonadota bacterium]
MTMRRWLSTVALLALTAGVATAQIEIVRPAPGDTLAGRVEVIVHSDAVSITAVHVRIGDRPWVPMAHAEGGTWRATLDSTLAPNGPARISAQQWPVAEGGTATVEVRLDNPLRHYWGDIHSHTAVSDGKMSPFEAYAYARDVAGLDFFSLTDHLERVEPAEWAQCLRAAWEANEDGRFATFAGLEWSKGVGHMCVYDPIGHTWPTSLAEFYTYAPAACAVAKFNHPGWRDTNFEEFAYSPEGDSVIQLIEVRTEMEMGWMIRALDEGWHIAPDGSDDSHAPNWGNCNRWTVVLAPGLTRANVIAALQRRHCYSTFDRNCRLHFWINGAVMGEVVGEPTRTAVVEVDVNDPDGSDTTKSIELICDGEVIATDAPAAPQRRWTLTLTPEAGEHYYFVKVTQADGNCLWSAPIWITVPGE